MGVCEQARGRAGREELWGREAQADCRLGSQEEGWGCPWVCGGRRWAGWGPTAWGGEGGLGGARDTSPHHHHHPPGLLLQAVGPGGVSGPVQIVNNKFLAWSGVMEWQEVSPGGPSHQEQQALADLAPPTPDVSPLPSPKSPGLSPTVGPRDGCHHTST